MNTRSFHKRSKVTWSWFVAFSIVSQSALLTAQSSHIFARRDFEIGKLESYYTVLFNSSQGGLLATLVYPRFKRGDAILGKRFVATLRISCDQFGARVRLSELNVQLTYRNHADALVSTRNLIVLRGAHSFPRLFLNPPGQLDSTQFMLFGESEAGEARTEMLGSTFHSIQAQKLTELDLSSIHIYFYDIEHGVESVFLSYSLGVMVNEREFVKRDSLQLFRHP